MVPAPLTRPKGPIKSERNKAAAAGGSSSAVPASSTSSAFHKKRAQPKSGYGNNAGAGASGSTNNWGRRGQEAAQAAQKNGNKQPADRASASRKEQPKLAPAFAEKDAQEQADEDPESDESSEDEDVRSKTALSLSGHQLPPLSALVDTLSQFRYLQRLDLSSIEPSETSPSGLSTLTWLAKAVFRSKASTKGKSRAFGDNLTWLNLGSNPNLTSDSCIGLEALEELCVLTLSHCALTSVPPSINPLRNLKALVLNNNAIPSLPKAFPHLPELNSLILSHNEIPSLPASLPASLPSLKKLSLGHNKLSGPESLPDFSLCLTLREVRLNDNPELKALPSHVRNWGKGADGKTAPGLELLELKDCGLDSWESLSTLAEKEDEKEMQPRLRRKGLAQLLLKGNKVAEMEGYKERFVEVHPTLRVLDNERLQPRVKPAEKEVEADEVEQKQGRKEKGKKQERPQRVQREEGDSEEDDDEAAAMAAEMRALRRGGSGKPAPPQRRHEPESEEESEEDDDEAAAMAAEMRALRRGTAAPPPKKENSKAKANGKKDQVTSQKKDKSATHKKKSDLKQSSKKTKDHAAVEGDDDRSKPKHKRGTRSGKKINKTEPPSSSLPKDKVDKNSGNAFFESVDEAAEKARLAPIFELSKKRAKIASGRTEVAEGVLEDASSTLSKARQRESKGRMELEMDTDNAPVKNRKGGVKKKQDEEKVVANTSVAGIVDLRKQAKGKEGRKRKAEDEVGAKKKARASLPFVPIAGGVGDGVGTGADAWGDGGAWA